MESSIGERMKSLRVERGMTLAELAEQVNLFYQLFVAD